MENSTTQMEETVTITATSMRWNFNTGWSVSTSWGPESKAYPPVGKEIISFQVTMRYENDVRRVFPGPFEDFMGWVTPAQLAIILKEASQAFPDLIGEVLLKETFERLFEEKNEEVETSQKLGVNN